MEIITPLRKITRHMGSVLPVTRQWWLSRLYHSQSWYSIYQPHRDAKLSWLGWWLYPKIVYMINTVTYLKNNWAMSWMGIELRPAITFPAKECHCPLTRAKLYWLVTEADRCEQLAQGCYVALSCVVGTEPTTYWSQVQCVTAMPLRHLNQHNECEQLFYRVRRRHRCTGWASSPCQTHWEELTVVVWTFSIHCMQDHHCNDTIIHCTSNTICIGRLLLKNAKHIFHTIISSQVQLFQWAI